MSMLDATAAPIERWLPISAYPGYEVSDQGRIRRGARIRKGTPDQNGYLRVSFWVDGKAKKVAIHLLVAEAFLGPRAPDQVTRHLNGSHTDARLSNLRYGTVIENEADKIEHGTQVNGTRHHAHKLTEEDVLAIRARYSPDARANGYPAIARDFGITRCTARRIVLRKIWKHLP